MPWRTPIRTLRRLSARMASWPIVGVPVRAVRRTMAREVMLFAGGVSFFTLLALFPLIAVAASAYGIFFSLDDLDRQIQVLSGVLPESSRTFIYNQAASLTVASRAALSVQGVIALLIALFAAARGAKALIAGLNQIARVGDLRNILRFNILAIFAVLAGGALITASNLIIMTVPGVIRPVAVWLGFEGLDYGAVFNEWTAVGAFMFTALALLYRYVMRRAKDTSWTAALLGAAITTGLWMLVSAGFSLYVSGIVHPTAYGSLGALVVFLLWIYWASYAVFFGGALTVEIDAARHRASAAADEEAESADAEDD